MKAKGYSRGFIPSEPAYSLLKKEIKKFSEKFKAPVFEPHITLLGEIEEKKDEMIKKAFTLTSRIKPFEVELNEICSGENYFQKLFYFSIKSAGQSCNKINNSNFILSHCHTLSSISEMKPGYNL